MLFLTLVFLEIADHVWFAAHSQNLLWSLATKEEGGSQANP
jgi:hypothetical protein